MTDNISDLNNLEAGTQCFPLKLFNDAQNSFLPEMTDGITKFGYDQFKDINDSDRTKEDVFYYIYGVLHSEEYKHRFFNNLTKQLPRIPVVKSGDDFCTFNHYGRRLSELHLNFEKQKKFDVVIKEVIFVLPYRRPKVLLPR